MNIYDSLLGIQNNNVYERDCILTAIVKENWKDDKKGLVKVEFFYGEEGKSQTEWARVAGLYTGNQYGIYFMPEIGSEVIVLFPKGNRNEPIILGGLWSEKCPLPEPAANEKNTIKRILTKAGHELVFDEEEGKEQITLQTKGKLKVNLADEKKVITVTDESQESSIVIDFENGKVTVDAKEKLFLSLGGEAALTLDGSGKKATMKLDNINLEASQGITLKGGSVKIEGTNIDLKGDTGVKLETSAQMTVKSGATLKLEGSAMTELKGGIVKIN